MSLLPTHYIGRLCVCFFVIAQHLFNVISNEFKISVFRMIHGNNNFVWERETHRFLIEKSFVANDEMAGRLKNVEQFMLLSLLL